MHSLLAYIIQVNILLAIVYIGYYVLLKKLTFYQLNRGYFLVGAVFSLVYPFLDIKSLFRKHIEPVGEWMAYLPDFYTEQVEKSVYTLENAIYIGIGIVGLWFGARLCIQLLSLLRIHLHSQKAVWKTYWYQNVLFPIVPFSFLNKIYLHKEQHQEPELYDIFEHEDIHVKGLHTVDIMMFEILLIVCWYNPFVWLMRRAVRQNLEYLTDQQVLNKGVDRQTYQYSLLQVSKQGASLGVSSQFNFKFLKKRIMMMNKKKSSKLQLSKYAFLLPIVIFSAGAFTISKADSGITEVVDVARDIRLDTFTKEDDRRIKSDSEDSVESVQHVVDTTRVEQDTLSRGKSTLIVKGLQGEPLYIVDGKRRLRGYDLDELNPNDIESINVLKGAHAIERYGDEAASGSVEIITKAKAKQDSVTRKSGKYVDTLNVSFQYDDSATAQGDASKGARSITVRGVKIDSAGTTRRTTTLEGKSTGLRIIGSGQVKNSSDTTKHRSLVIGKLDPEKDPLFVIDGKVQEGSSNLTTLDPDQIESVTVLKDKSATSVYGDKAKNGVIMVAMKKENASTVNSNKEWYTDDDVFYIDGKAVSKNEFKAVAREDIATIETKGWDGEKGRRIEIKTK